MAILQNSLWLPPDRDLALRGQIRTGWSTLAARKPNRYTTSGSGNLTEEEVKIIRTVINKADALERKEQIRIGLLNLQYEQLRSNARGDGDTSCIICGYDFKVPKSLVTIQLHICQECTNAVCSRCKADYKKPSGEIMILCRLCYDSRELWKKSGAWLMNGSLPPIVMVSKDELEKIQMALLHPIDKRARDTPSPISPQDTLGEDKEEDDQSYVGLHSNLRVSVKSSQEGLNFGGSYPPYGRKRGESQGLSRRRGIRKNRSRSPRHESWTHTESPGDEDGGDGSVGGSVTRLGIAQQGETHPLSYSRQSRASTPQIVIDAPRSADVPRSSVDLTEGSPICSNAQPPAAALTTGVARHEPGIQSGTSAVASLPAGNSPDPSPGDPDPSPGTPSRLHGNSPNPSPAGNPDPSPGTPSRLHGSLSHEDILGLDEGEDGSQRLHRRSKVISGRHRVMQRTRNIDQLGTLEASGSDSGRADDMPHLAGPPERQTSARPSEQGDDGDFKRTKPRLQPTMISAGEKDDTFSTGGGVATSGVGSDDEFKKVRTVQSASGPGPKLLSTGSEVTSGPKADDNEFRKVKIIAPSPQTTSDAGVALGLEGSQVGLGEEFRKVKIIAPSPQAASGAGATLGYQLGLDEEFRKVKIESEKPIELGNIVVGQQPSDKNMELQANKTDKDESTITPLRGSTPQGSLSQDTPSGGSSPSHDESTTSQHTPSMQKKMRRRVIQSSHRTSPDRLNVKSGSAGEEEEEDRMNPRLTGSSEGHVDAGGGDDRGGVGGAHKQLTAECTHVEAVVDVPLSVTLHSEPPVQEGEEVGTSQAALQDPGTDDTPQGDEGEGRGTQNRQRHQWKRRQVVSRRGRKSDDDPELGPRPRSRVISEVSPASSPLPRRHPGSHDNASPASDDM